VHIGACWGRVEAAHVKTKGSGGEELGNMVPLCALHHRLSPLSLHNVGIATFQAERHLDLPRLAAAYRVRYEGSA
jgi:hypothetical protein